MDTRVTNLSYELTVTVDCAIFGFTNGSLKILLVKRGVPPYQGYWMLPGGIVHAHQTLEEAAENVLENLLNANDIYLEQVKAYSDIDRHPLKRVMTVGFYALIKPEDHFFEAKDYLEDAQWFSMHELTTLGFDHNTIMKDAFNKLKNEINYRPLGFELLPEKFTLKELQELYENILEEKFDRRNFRRKITSLELVVDTNENKIGVQGNPRLYRFNDKKFSRTDFIDKSKF